MSFRRLLILALMVLAASAGQLAYLISYASFTWEIARLGTAATLGKVASLMAFGTLVASFIGAAVAYGIGARISAALSTALALLGYGVLALGGPTTLGWVLVAIGLGMFHVCPYAVAAEVFETAGESTRRFTAMSAFAMLLGIGYRVSSLLGPAIGGYALNRSGSSMASSISAGFALLTTLFATGALVAGAAEARADDTRTTAGPYRAPAPMPPSPTPAPSSSSSSSIIGVFLLTAVTGVVGVGQSAGTFKGLITITMTQRTLLLGIASTVSLIASVIAFVVLTITAQSRSTERSPPIAGLAVAMALVGLGLLVMAPTENYVAFCVGTFATALGSALLPIGAAYVALALKPHAAAFAVAVWLSAGTIGNVIGSVLGASALRSPLLLLVGLASVGGGGAIAYFARRLHGTFMSSTEPLVRAPLQ